MWLMTDRGFYSIVEKEWDVEDQTLTVRARRREDIEEFISIVLVRAARCSLKPSRPELAAPDSPFIEYDPDADYAWRIRATREAVTAAIGQLTADIDYSNFKTSVHEKGLDDHHAAYSSVWGVMQRLQHCGPPHTFNWETKVEEEYWSSHM